LLSGGCHGANQRKFPLKENEMTRTNRLVKAGLKALTIGLTAMGLAVGASALATKSQPAFAYTPKASGQPGLTQVPVTQGSSNGAGWPQVTFPARYVWRSDGYAGTQVITVTYRLWKYSAASASWGLYASRVSSAQVAPNGIGSWITAWLTPVPFDHYSVNFQVDWTTLDGSLFGWKIIDYNTPTDYQCLTATTTCAVYPSGSVGAFIYFPPPAPKPVATAQPTQAPAPAGATSVTIPGGSDPAYGSASSGGSSSVTFSVNSVDDYARFFGGAGGQSDAGCGGACHDYDGLLGRTPGGGMDIYSQLNQTGAVIAALQNAANNPYFGQVLY